MSESEQEERLEPRSRSLLRKSIEFIYQRVPGPYDRLSDFFTLGHGRNWQRATIGFLLGPRVLEVGMGTGNLQVDLMHSDYQVYGLDYSFAMLQEASRKARKAGRGRLMLCRGRTQELPFATGSFDSVVSTFGSDYLTSVETHQEIWRVLRPGGRAVLVPGGSILRGQRRSAFLDLFRGRPANTGGNMLIEPLTEEQGRQVAVKWIGYIMGLLADQGFIVSTYLASDERSIALVILADKLSDGGL